jgi:hypothetical protein
MSTGQTEQKVLHKHGDATRSDVTVLHVATRLAGPRHVSELIT